MIVHIGVHLSCMDLDCSMKKATRTTCQCKILATNRELTQLARSSNKMTTAILDDPFPICGQVSGSFRALEVCIRISLAIARQVLEHQKLSCHLSQLKALAWCILNACWRYPAVALLQYKSGMWLCLKESRSNRIIQGWPVCTDAGRDGFHHGILQNDLESSKLPREKIIITGPD